MTSKAYSRRNDMKIKFKGTTVLLVVVVLLNFSNVFAENSVATIDLETEWQYLTQVAAKGGGYEIWANEQAIEYGLDISIAKKVPVLMYHHMIKGYDINQGSIIATEAFEAQIKWAYDHGWQSITVEELHNHLTGTKFVKPKSFVITFDDGYESTYIEAYPIIKKYGFQATEYLIGNSNAMTGSTPISTLTWEQVNEMSDVFEFGNHTYDMHRWAEGKKSGVLAHASYDAITEDLSKLNTELESRGLGDHFKSLAYPYGREMIDYSETTMKALTDLDIKIAFTTEHGYADFNDDLLQIERFSIFEWTQIYEFARYMKNALR